jgi:hypothetical protein
MGYMGWGSSESISEMSRGISISGLGWTGCLRETSELGMWLGRRAIERSESYWRVWSVRELEGILFESM